MFKYLVESHLIDLGNLINTAFTYANVFFLNKIHGNGQN